MNSTVTADPASPEEMGAAAVTAITEALKAAATKRPPVDRQAHWRIEGTPYSAACLTVGDLTTRIADAPDHLPVLFHVPDFDCRDVAPLRSTTWDGALVLRTTPAEPDCSTLPLDLPAPVDATLVGAAAPATRRVRPEALTVGDLARVLTDLPDHAPVMAVVPGWAGTDELAVDRADDYGDCLVLDTGYPTCDPYGPDDPEDTDA
ncbi:hypothetical protein ACFC26_28090 [Kitasatospora purpeofusca]|uniref:hypothetical protein n=1 Tax=Kitasatospora purpeofusca TaxID=67352 RepID=UPI0035D9BA05